MGRLDEGARSDRGIGLDRGARADLALTGAEGMETEADGVLDEVMTEVDKRAFGGLYGSDEALAIAQCMLEEKTQEYLVDVAAYKTRISDLESKLAILGVRADSSSSNVPILEAEEFDCAPLVVDTSLQIERDAAVEQARLAELYILELSTTDKNLQSELEVLMHNSFQAENHALRQEMV